MIKSYFRWQSGIRTLPLALFVLAALGANLWASGLLEAAYAASAFPVRYYEAQLSFDAEKLKHWYGFLLQNGTFDKYIHAQNVDFLFIGSVLALHLSALLLISRLLPPPSTGRRLLVWASALSAVAPISDALENGISYVMLADPTGFEPGLALVYSALAAVKFGMFTLAYAAAVAGLLAALWYGVHRIGRQSNWA